MEPPTDRLPGTYPGHQVIAGMIRSSEGWLINACDGGPDNNEGSVIQISRDDGRSWTSPCGEKPEEFEAGRTGGMIAGIHACVVQLRDGSLMAFGRGNDVADAKGRRRMTRSISGDMGKTWRYEASPFPPISGGQRCTMIRLKEGPIVLVSFTHHPLRPPKDEDRMRLGGRSKAACSPPCPMTKARRGPSANSSPTDNTGSWTAGRGPAFFETDADRAEPRGYLTMTQSPDGIIHLLSSKNHYRFNLKWLEQND